MFKKAAAATAITAALLAIGSPAFADDIDVTEQVGVANLSDTDILNQLNVCDIDVIQVVDVELDLLPIASPNCANEDVDVEIDD